MIREREHSLNTVFANVIRMSFAAGRLTLYAINTLGEPDLATQTITSKNNVTRAQTYISGNKCSFVAHI